MCATAGLKDADRSGLLKDVRPDLAEEYETETNSKPVDSVTCGSKIRANWKCKECGRLFQRRIWERVRYLGCPSCTSEKKQGNKPVSKAIPTLEVLDASVILAGPLPENAPAKEHKTGKEESQDAAPKASVKERATSKKGQTQIEEKKEGSGRKKAVQADPTGASEVL